MINPFLYFLLFLKASLFSTGGTGNLPSLYQDLISLGWATETDFAQAIAIGQVSPGPTGLWVICLGYLTYGWLGVMLAFLAILIPPFLVLALAAVYYKIQNRPSIRGLLRGIGLAVVGLTGVIAYTFVTTEGKLDWRSVLIASVAFAVGFSRKVNVLVILLGAGLAGYLFYGL
jgi:chromate transporter